MNPSDAEEREILAAYEAGELIVAQDSAEIRQRHQVYAKHQLWYRKKQNSEYFHPDTRRKTSTG